MVDWFHTVQYFLIDTYVVLNHPRSKAKTHSRTDTPAGLQWTHSRLCLLSLPGNIRGWTLLLLFQVPVWWRGKCEEIIKIASCVSLLLLSLLWWNNQRSGEKLHKVDILLFLLCAHIGLYNEALDGEVEDQRSDCGVEHSGGKELVSQVDRKEIRLAGSVQPVGREAVSFKQPCH